MWTRVSESSQSGASQLIRALDTFCRVRTSVDSPTSGRSRGIAGSVVSLDREDDEVDDPDRDGFVASVAAGQNVPELAPGKKAPFANHPQVGALAR